MAMTEEERELVEEFSRLGEDLRRIEGEVEAELGALDRNKNVVQDFHAVERASNSVSAKLTRCRALLREVQAISEEATREEVFAELCKESSRHARRLEENRIRAREVLGRASVELKRRAAREEREELLGRGHGAMASAKPAARKTELEAAQSLTSSLQRTRQLLAHQLDHTESTMAVMDESGKTLTKVGERYDEHSGLLGKGKHLLTSMERQERLERFLLYAAFVLFLLAVVYVGGKRFFYFAPLHRLVPHRGGKGPTGAARDFPEAMAPPQPPPPPPPQPQQPEQRDAAAEEGGQRGEAAAIDREERADEPPAAREEANAEAAAGEVAEPAAQRKAVEEEEKVVAAGVTGAGSGEPETEGERPPEPSVEPPSPSPAQQQQQQPSGSQRARAGRRVVNKEVEVRRSERLAAIKARGRGGDKSEL